MSKNIFFKIDVQRSFELSTGFEPMTTWLQIKSSTNWATKAIKIKNPSVFRTRVFLYSMYMEYVYIWISRVFFKCCLGSIIVFEKRTTLKSQFVFQLIGELLNDWYEDFNMLLLFFILFIYLYQFNFLTIGLIWVLIYN